MSKSNGNCLELRDWKGSTFVRGSCQMKRCCPSCCSFLTHPLLLRHGHPLHRLPLWRLPRTEPRTVGETTHWHSLPTEFPQLPHLPWCHRQEVLTRAQVRYPWCPPSWGDGVAVLMAVAATTKRMRRQDRRPLPRPHCLGSNEGGGELKKTLPLPPPAHKKQNDLYQQCPRSLTSYYISSSSSSSSIPVASNWSRGHL